MADKKLNELPIVEEFDCCYVEKDGKQGRILEGALLDALMSRRDNGILMNIDLNKTLAGGLICYVSSPVNAPYGVTNGLLLVFRTSKNLSNSRIVQILCTDDGFSYIRTLQVNSGSIVKENSWKRLDESPADLKATIITNGLSYVYGEKSDGTQGRVSKDDIAFLGSVGHPLSPTGVSYVGKVPYVSNVVLLISATLGRDVGQQVSIVRGASWSNGVKTVTNTNLVEASTSGAKIYYRVVGNEIEIYVAGYGCVKQISYINAAFAFDVKAAAIPGDATLL